MEKVVTKNNEYLPRILDGVLKNALSEIGAVLIVGPKWCGKTTTAEKCARSVIKLQDPDMAAAYEAAIDTKPSLLLRGDNPRLIDEWQVYPVLWDAVRTSVDERGEDGLYILTGSTVVDETKIMHSGTGRIATITMLPMSLYESKESNGSISLKKLFDDQSYCIDGLTSQLTIEKLVYASCRGGWPTSLRKEGSKALSVAKSYLRNICNRDCSSVDKVERSPFRAKAVLRSYARNVSTLASDRTLLRDLAFSDAGMDVKTLASYLRAFEKLYVISELEAWNPSIRSSCAVRSSHKRELIDPSLASAALNLSPEALLDDLNTFGFIFETLCVRDLRVYSSALGGEISYYHDNKGLEADAVLHLDDGRYALIEFKLGGSQIDQGAAHLLELRRLIQEHNSIEGNAKIKEPSFLMVLTGGAIALTRPDGVKVVPIGCLRD